MREDTESDVENDENSDEDSSDLLDGDEGHWKEPWEAPPGCVNILHRFEVPGRPVGHTATTYRDKGVSKRYRKYKEYAKRIRDYASGAGVDIPLSADKENRLFIRVRAYFFNGVHPDLENVRKGAVDAMFYDPLSRRKGDDKWVAGQFPLPLFDKEDPRLEVEIGEYLTKPEDKRGLDLTGKRFGILDVLEFDGIKDGRSYWICACDCGKKISTPGSSLNYGNSKSCGCGDTSIIGEKFGHWSVGNWRRVHYLYRKKAEYRGLDFGLSVEQFVELASSDCEYCGAEPSAKVSRGNTRNPIVRNGVDRIDNDLGYDMDNCVACCKICNYAKNDLPVDAFNAWRVRILRKTRADIRLGAAARIPIKLKKKKKKRKKEE